jgi:hypothetical protein
MSLDRLAGKPTLQTKPSIYVPTIYHHPFSPPTSRGVPRGKKGREGEEGETPAAPDTSANEPKGGGSQAGAGHGWWGMGIDYNSSISLIEKAPREPACVAGVT